MADRLRRVDRLIWYTLAAIVLALIGVVVPWLLTRNNLAPGWSKATVKSAIHECDTASYPDKTSGTVTAAACRCVTDKVSHTVPLKVSSYATQNAGQVEVQKATASCNRRYPAT